MKLHRREALLHALFGAGLVGLRSLVTGIPAAILLDPRKVLADTPAPAIANPQFLIFSTSSSGDPLNCNAPGTYDDPAITHAADPAMAATPISFNGKSVKGAQIWSTLPASVLSRTVFFHHGTYTVVHPDEAKVLRVMGSVASGEMLPSMIARELAPSLGTVRAQPISLNGNASESVFFQGAPQPLLTPTTLSSMIAAPTNGLGTADLLKLRDRDLDALNAFAKSQGARAQNDFIDKYATSREQLRNLQDKLLTTLSTIKDNSADSQIKAAIALFQMKVTPVVSVHIGFGGDNHSDAGLAGEVTAHKNGVATIAAMMQALTDAQLQDQVTFCMTNVFGRNLALKSPDGRGHLDNHHVSVLIGPRLKGGVVGGVSRPNANRDFTATAIDSASGASNPSGDIPFKATFQSMAKTLTAATGVPQDLVDKNVLTGTTVKGALVGT